MNRENKRAIDHHLEAQNTTVHWIARHHLAPSQRKTIEVLHGKCKIQSHWKNFDNEEAFIKFFLSLSQKQDTAGIYFVSPSSWKETLLDSYLNKINGTVFGWFIGFGKSDKFNLVKQELFYRNKHHWFKFPVEMNFGKTEFNQRKVKKHFHNCN